MPGEKKKKEHRCVIYIKNTEDRLTDLCSWRKDRVQREVTDSRKIYNSVELSKSMTGHSDDIREAQRECDEAVLKWEMSGVTRIMD